VTAPVANLPRIAFVHIPKCGGQSVQRRLAEYYGQESCLRVGAARFGGDIETARGPDDWQDALAEARVVYGHYSWAFLDEMIGRAGAPRFTPLCLVREPLERAISEYWFVRRTPEHPAWSLCQGASISEYLLNHHDHNCQCQFVGGSRLFGEALERIQRDFEAVCPMDEIDRFVHLLARAMGQPGRPAPSVNRSMLEADKRRVGPRTASRFYEKNGDDLKLYWWIAEHWREHWRFGGRIAEIDPPDSST
jgi:hypothetical protein